MQMCAGCSGSTITAAPSALCIELQDQGLNFSAELLDAPG
jgi:hypothetical protein